VLDSGAVGVIFKVPPSVDALTNGPVFSLTADIDIVLAQLFATDSTYTESAMSFMTPPDATDLSDGVVAARRSSSTKASATRSSRSTTPSAGIAASIATAVAMRRISFACIRYLAWATARVDPPPIRPTSSRRW
jgi:hypothetical protein